MADFFGILLGCTLKILYKYSVLLLHFCSAIVDDKAIVLNKQKGATITCILKLVQSCKALLKTLDNWWPSLKKI